MDADLLVVGRDPAFGGGGRAQTAAFLDAATALGRTTQLVYDAHPGLHGPRFTWRRVEALRALTSHRRVTLPASRSLWVVSTHASDGRPAEAAGRRYACWIGTTVESEWHGRRAGLPGFRRFAARLGLAGLRGLERRVLTGADAVFATSTASREQLVDASGRSDIGVLPIPIDIDRFHPAPDEEWLERANDPTVVFVGRADDPRKNIALLLDAARRLSDVRFMLAGNPPPGPLPSNVVALGRVDETADVLRRGTVFALPSLQEGFGIVAAEALSCGVPVLTTPSGGPEDLVRRSNAGVVTASFGADEFAARLEALLRDSDELLERRHRGREYVERHHAPWVFRQALQQAFDQVDS